ncbi:flagellar motor protein MotB [Neobacillus ginsengisoli]|uniref:Chemotaxis protein MotB n=1 Tax=Neobacillus ginsengisoli TaxID=904295 RepID=A0ABT9XVJ6_9BACI|nr:flagellar motor protein MotB [Neobacillus ginsengisoli]MDQ0199592.1 chemotaxis protein MotB [Neobacillus ginsengisoli]
MRNQRKKFEEEHEEHIDESWLIPYADILTLLLALFIVLFASSSINKYKYEGLMNALKAELTGAKIENHQSGPTTSVKNKQIKIQQQPQQQPNSSSNVVVKTTEDIELDQLKQKLEKYIIDNHLQTVVTLQDSKRGVEVTLKEVILFDSGSAVLKERSFQTLDGLVGLINTVSNPISIEGHTDNVPIISTTYPSNWELSSARAASVLHYFQSKNIAANRLQFTGYGEYKPLFPNDNNAHRQANRRVTIVILRNS